MSLRGLIVYLVPILFCHCEAQFGCQEIFGPHSNWLAATVDSGDDLKKAIGHKGQNSDSGILVKLQVINGTNWLNLGGDVHSFGLVVGRPPSTSSDLTLKNAVDQLVEFGANGVLLEFHPPELQDLMTQDINKNPKGLPLWSFHSIERNDINVTFANFLPALKWSQKRYGLDKVLGRVEAENLLLHFDFERTKEILTTFYSYGRRPLTENSITYLKRKYQTVQRMYPNTFTEVYLNNLLHLVEADTKTTGTTLLKDLQDLDESYTKEDIQKLEEKLSVIPGSQCVLVQVRAGIFLQTESIENLGILMKKHQNRIKLLVTSLEQDLVSVKPLATAIDLLGKQNLILDFPESLAEEMKLISHIPNNIQELAKSSASAAVQTFSYLITCITTVLFYFYV